MNIVDTSGWLAYFSANDNADKFAKTIQNTSELIVPVICIYELSKVVLRESDESHLLQIIAAVQQGQVINIDPLLCVKAAKNSLKYKLSMTDSIIYTIAEQFNATLWTQDIDFKGLPNVNYFAKP